MIERSDDITPSDALEQPVELDVIKISPLALCFVQAPDGSFMLDYSGQLTRFLKNERRLNRSKKSNKDIIKQEPVYVECNAQALFDFHDNNIKDQSLSDWLRDVQTTITNAIEQNIALARKSGDCIAGYTKVSQLLSKNSLHFLIYATDITGKDGIDLINKVCDSKKYAFANAQILGAIFNKEKTMLVGFNSQHFLNTIKNGGKQLDCLFSAQNHAISTMV